MTGLNHTALFLFLNNTGVTDEGRGTRVGMYQLSCFSPTEKKSTEFVLCSVTSLKLMSKSGVCRTESVEISSHSRVVHILHIIHSLILACSLIYSCKEQR